MVVAEEEIRRPRGKHILRAPEDCCVLAHARSYFFPQKDLCGEGAKQEGYTCEANNIRLGLITARL
jgi:hypothetical protein